ncbi:MAG TPA: ADP-heptose--LPS heptosyltransferase [Rhodospirillaceae bacterium]|nr:ADP-heptose--LPS heptosyltransferase [Rhodospirillaceae bacterium]
MSERILVIKLGALGDLVLCMGAFAAIRKAHPDAEIALLTMPPFQGFAKDMPWFDRVIIDPRPKPGEIGKWINLIRDVRAFAPTRVYDFQGKPRQSILFHALGWPEWSGAALGCSHPRAWPPTPQMHYTDFLAAQLEKAGVTFERNPDLSWLAQPLDMELPEKFALLIPGCAPQHPHKRWPATHYAALADKLKAQGITVMAIGTKADADSINAIRALAPDVVDMVGKTTLKQLATLARSATYVIGNDTGPTHLAAAVRAQAVALMSDRVNPYWSAPRGTRTTWLQGKPLSALTVDDVWQKVI